MEQSFSELTAFLRNSTQPGKAANGAANGAIKNGVNTNGATKNLSNWIPSIFASGTANDSLLSWQTGSRVISYVFGILVILLILLLFVHFFITPVFQLQAGAPGKILVPGFDDGVLFWSKTTPGQILNKDLPIETQSFGYSMILDLFIQNPLQFSSHPRLLFTRGATKQAAPSGDTLLGVLSNYNLAVALLPDTNDMIVSVLNKDNNMENVIVSNVPIQEPFRLGVIVMENALEVYLDGKLIKTRTFQTTPKSVVGDIYPASGIEANMAKVRNLKIWPRVLLTSEIRYARPALSTSTEMGAGPMPPSSTSAMCH
jgi:hypothetical protein